MGAHTKIECPVEAPIALLLITTPTNVKQCKEAQLLLPALLSKDQGLGCAV
jgi:hypothetical protein